jgi:hypothetical protein
MEELFRLLGNREVLRIANLLLKSRRVTLLELELLLELDMELLKQRLADLVEQGVIYSFATEERQFYQLNPRFVEEHEQLYDYLLNKMKSHVVFLSDLNRFNRYRLNRLTEQDIRDNRERVLNIVN